MILAVFPALMILQFYARVESLPSPYSLSAHFPASVADDPEVTTHLRRPRPAVLRRGIACARRSTCAAERVSQRVLIN